MSISNLKYIEIDTGQLILNMLSMNQKLTVLQVNAKGKLQFMCLIGVFGLTINDEPILKEMRI